MKNKKTSKHAYNYTASNHNNNNMVWKKDVTKGGSLYFNVFYAKKREKIGKKKYLGFHKKI